MDDDLARIASLCGTDIAKVADELAKEMRAETVRKLALDRVRDRLFREYLESPEFVEFAKGTVRKAVLRRRVEVLTANKERLADFDELMAIAEKSQALGAHLACMETDLLHAIQETRQVHEQVTELERLLIDRASVEGLDLREETLKP